MTVLSFFLQKKVLAHPTVIFIIEFAQGVNGAVVFRR